MQVKEKSIKKNKNIKNYLYLFLLTFKSILFTKENIIFSTIIIIVNIILYSISAFTLIIDENIINNIDMANSILFIANNFIFGIIIIFSLYKTVREQLDDGFINLEIQSGIPNYVSFIVRILSVFLFIYLVITINLIFVTIIGSQSFFENSTINNSFFTRTALFYYLSSLIFLSVTVILMLLSSKILSIIFSMTFLMFFSLQSFLGDMIQSMSIKEEELIELKDNVMSGFNAEIGSEFYNSLKDEKIYSELFDEEKFIEWNEYIKFNIHKNFHSLKDWGEISNCSYSADITPALFMNCELLSEFLFLGQLNLFFYDKNEIENDNFVPIKAYDNDLLLGKIVNITYDFFASGKLDSNYEGLTEGNNPWIFYDDWEKPAKPNEKVDVDIEYSITEIKKNYPEYSTIFDLILILYNKYKTYILINDDSNKSPFYLHNIWKNDSNDDKLQNLWPNIIEGSEHKALFEKNKPILETYYKYPELLIINFILLQSYRYSSYFSLPIGESINEYEEILSKNLLLNRLNIFELSSKIYSYKNSLQSDWITLNGGIFSSAINSYIDIDVDSKSGINTNIDLDIVFPFKSLNVKIKSIVNLPLLISVNVIIWTTTLFISYFIFKKRIHN